MTSLWSHFDATSIGTAPPPARPEHHCWATGRSSSCVSLVHSAPGAPTTAIAATVALVVTGTITWDDILRNEDGWDTVVWLGGLVSMAGEDRVRRQFGSVRTAWC